MASFKYYIRKPINGKASIYFRLSYGAYEIVKEKKRYTPFEYYISESIEPKFWNKKEGKSIRKGFAQFAEFNATLDNIKNDVLNIVRRLSNDGVELNNDTIKIEVDKLLNREPGASTPQQMELMDFVNYFISTCDRTEGTKKSYKRVEKDLHEYQERHKVKLTFDKIDVDFHTNFIKDLKSRKYSPNTIGTRIKILKTFMNQAYERNLHSNLDYKKSMFSKPIEETRAIYLNAKELSMIYKLDLSDNTTLENVRDWFLIGSYTGLRFSDLGKLTNDNFTKSTIEITTQKTDTSISIPLHPIVSNILNKHNYSLPKLMSNQKFNEYIKEVAKLAKIDEPILVEQTKGTLKTKQTVSKYTLISAHTARRSFATNAFIAGVPPIQIMKLTGHKTEASFMKYIKISNAENAKQLQLHSFFNMVANQ